MPLPVTIWLYFLFALMIFSLCCAFVSWIFSEVNKKNLEDLKREADEKYFEANHKHW